MSKPKVGQFGLSRSLLHLHPAPLIALSTIPLHLQRGWTKKSVALSQLASLLLQCNNWTTFSCWLENLCWLVALLVLHCSVPGWLPSPVASHPCYLLPPWSFLHPFRSPILLRITSAILVLLAVPFSPLPSLSLPIWKVNSCRSPSLPKRAPLQNDQTQDCQKREMWNSLKIAAQLLFICFFLFPYS